MAPSDGPDLSRREFMLAGSTSLLALQGSVEPQLDTKQPTDEYQFRGVADLIGPAAAKPAPDDPFFEQKVAYAYRYEATNGGRYFITDDSDRWETLMDTPTTQVDEVRVEDYEQFFDHTFARPNAPDDKNWVYTDADVTKSGSEIELASTTTLETTQHGSYPPGTEVVAGGAFRVTGTPTGGDGRAGYFNDTDGFGAGEDATDSFLFLRKGGTDYTVRRSEWNGYQPDSRVWVSSTPVVTRFPHLFYGGGSVDARALIHENGETNLRTLHTFTPENLPDSWPDGPPFDQPNLPFRFTTNSLTGGSLRANAAHYERGEADAETRKSGEHFHGVSVGTSGWTPLMSVRKRSGWEMVNIQPLLLIVQASSADVKLEVQLDPVLSGATFSLPTHASADETSIEVTQQGSQGSIDTNGDRRLVDFAPGGGGNKAGAAATQEFELSVPNSQIVTLAAQAVGSSATVSGALAVEEFF